VAAALHVRVPALALAAPVLVLAAVDNPLIIGSAYDKTVQ